MSNREPLLSDEDVESFIDEWANGGKRSDYAIRDFYEDKLANGKLMVVKTVKRTEYIVITHQIIDLYGHEHVVDVVRTSCCNEPVTNQFANFCPGCGSKILAP